MHGTLKAIRRYDVNGVTCYLASDAKDLLGVDRKTITRRQKAGRYTRIWDEDLKRVMVPVKEIDAELLGKPESEDADG
jgi:hypothetical protein